MMQSTTFLTGLLVACLPIGILALECLTNSTIRPGYLPLMELTSPTQLAEFSSCDTLTGYIHVSPEFKGTLELPASVTNLTGYIKHSYGQPSNGLEGVILPNVRYMEGIELWSTYGVKRVYAPRLETVGSLIVEQAVEEGATMDFEALRKVDTIALSGYWSSISFPSLEEITYSMSVHTDPTRSETDVLIPVDIDLPVLKEAGELSLNGQIKSLSTPLLEVLGKHEDYFSLTVRANYTAMEGLFFPALRELVGDFRVNGSVSAVDLGGMENTSAPIKIDVESPIEIYSGLKNAGKIFVRGPLAVINFTNLTTASDLNITTTSDTPISCPRALIDIYRYFSSPSDPPFCNAESISAAGSNPYADPEYTPVGGYPTPSATITSDLASTSTWGYGGGSTPTPWWSPTPTPVYSPTPTPGDGGGKLSTGAEAAIATVAVVVGLVGIGGWVFVRRRNGRGKAGGAGSGSGNGDGATGTGGSELGPVAAAGVRNTTSRRRDEDGEEGEGLPRHSADVAPPPYSREEPRKL